MACRDRGVAPVEDRERHLFVFGRLQMDIPVGGEERSKWKWRR